MPTTAEFLAAQPDAIANMKAGSDYVNSLYSRAANLKAGGQFGSGDYTGAASTLASSGNIPDATAVAATGAQRNTAGAQYLAQALPVFQKISDTYKAQGPQAQGTAMAAAFDHLWPEIQQMTNASPQTGAAIRQGFMDNPDAMLAHFQAQIPVEWHTAGDSLVGTQGKNVVTNFQGLKYIDVAPGHDQVPVGGNAASTSPVPAPQGGTAPDGTAAPLGIRANNPGNLQPGGQEAQFTTPYAGIVAASANLDSYASRGLNTVSKIISTWAPPTDAQGKPINDTASYIADVAQKLGVDPNAPLNLKDHNLKGELLSAIFQHENGQQPNVGGPQPSQAAQPNGEVPGTLHGSRQQEIPLSADELKAYNALPGSTKNSITGAITRASPANSMPNYADDDLASMAYLQLQNGGKPLQGRDPETNRLVTQKMMEPVSKGGLRPDNMSSQDWAQLITNTGIGTNGQKQAASVLAKQNAMTSVNEGTVNNSIKILTNLLPVAASKGKFTAINEFEQYLARQTNNPNAINLKNAIDSISAEYARVMTGSTTGAPSSDSARREAGDRILLGYNQGSLPSVLAQMQAEMRGRSDAQTAGLRALTGGQFGGTPVSGQQPQAGTVIKYDAKGNRIP